MTNKKKGWRVFKILFVVLNIIAVLCILMAYGAAFVNPGKNWFFAFFGLAYPIVLLVNLFFVFLWLILWKKYIFLSLCALLIGYNHLNSILPLRFPSKEKKTSESIKIISYNVHSLYGKKIDAIIPETRSKVTEFLSNQHADIICIQEFNAMGEDFTKTLLKFTHSINLTNFFFKNYQDFYNKKKINAIATFSKYPIVRNGTFRLPKRSYFATFVDILFNPGDTVRVYNLHLESYRFGDEDYTFYSHLTDPGSESTQLTSGSRKMFWKLRKAFIFRARQVDILKQDIANCPYPVIVCGDFNDSPFSYTYSQLRTNLADAYNTAGNGFFGSTYAGKLPSFRIDYIFYSSYFKASDYHKFEIDLSDHYPIVTTLSINP